MTELDKFKRRIIRSVARLLFKEKKTEEELWAQMKKETGSDCRTLWERMRALCVKKLNRMIEADDRSSSLPKIARLSLTDWLLVDLVLVHEEIDVIAMEKADQKEYPALIELFNLVQRFDVEARCGEPLAEAWAAATVYYNRQGRQCSPMLLQRRWYQLKKLTRYRFYKFWFSYRGNTRYLEEARKTMPSRLQMAIAKRYPKVITAEYPDWEELIEKRFVIMPEEFEAKMRMPNLPKPCNSDAPDLVVVEPVIETIDLRVESDPEDNNNDMEDASDPEKSNDATDIASVTEEIPINETDIAPVTEGIPVNETDIAPVIEEIPVNDEPPSNDVTPSIQIKTEPMEEDGLSNVQLISARHVPEEIPEKSPDEITDVEPSNQDREGILDECPDDVTDVEPGNSEVEERQVDDSLDEDEDDIIAIPSVIPSDNLEKSPSDNIAQTEKEVNNVEIPPPNVSRDVETVNDSDKPVVSCDVNTINDSDDAVASCDVDTINDSDEAVDDIIKIKADEYCRKTNEVPAEKFDSIDDLIKDKIETYLKTPAEDISLTDKKPDSTNDLKNKTEVAALDLMADLNFVDDGIEFVDDGVEFVDEESSQIPESTSKIPTSEKIDVIHPDESKDNEETNTFDLKLLLYPVVYTTKLDQMTIFKNKEIDLVRSIEDIEMANIESKPVSNKSFNIKIKEESVTSIVEDTAHSDDIVIKREVTAEDDDEENADDDVYEEDEDDDELVPSNSYMLKKPKTRTYDPIKLCKNPDFNTKLKRLTIGFLSSTRNRQLLNACIPMTIDVSKAFESKLVNGTIYLKPSDTAPIIVKQEEIEKQASSIIPTAMPAQSLIDNSKVDIQNLIVRPTAPVDPMIPERTKIINLPDIDKVRRINQQLLTAQVPPLRVFAGNNRLSNEPPQEVNSMPPTLPSNVSTDTETTSIDNTLPKIKVEHEKSSDTTVSETLTPAKEKLLKIINQAKISTKEALEKLDDGTTPKDFPMPIVVKEVKKDIPIELPKAYQKPCPFLPRKRASVSWAPKYAPLNKKNFDDFGLLTSDTLNKMLNLLTSGTQNCGGCTSKNKKSKCDHIQNRVDNKTSQTKNSEQSTQTGKEKDTVKVDDKEESKKPKKSQAKKATTKVVPLSKVVRSNFCCWANQKLCNLKRVSRHLCPPNPCTCCCADILVKKIQADEEKSRRKKELDKMTDKFIVELSDDEEHSLKKACESIETVVQQSAQLTERNNDSVQEKTTIPVVTVSSTVDEDVAPVAKVTISLDGIPTEVTETPTTPTTPPKPLIKIRAAPISSLMPVERPVLNRPPTKAHIIIRPPSTPVTVRRMPLPAPSVLGYQVRSQLKPISPVKWTVCSCQKPALSQDTRRNIVIDGSKNCVIHPTPIAPKLSPQKTIPVQKPNTPVQNDKVVYLHSKSLAKSPSESPIFLGKNKILLTTVKFPRKNEEVTPVLPEVFPTPKVIPTLPLPNGVQLVLMPTGNVTYSVDPGVELDEAQLATLPTILAAVQEQLNASGITSTAVTDPQVSATGDINPVTTDSEPEVSTPEISNLPQNEEVTETVQTESNVSNETMEPPLVNLQTSEVFEDTELPSKITNNVDLEVDAESTKTNAPTEQNTCSTTNTSELEKEAEFITDLTGDEDPKAQPALTETPLPVEELQNQTQTQETEMPSTNEESQSQTPAQESEIPTEARKGPDDTEGISSRKSLLSDLMEMSGISAEDATVPEPPAIEPIVTNEVPATGNVIVNDESRNFPELSPVTSFAELKYACEQNGKFFKLDIDSGVLVPINVCIKKNKKIEPKTKEFIDLTDDVESPDVENIMDTADESNEDSLLKTYVYNGKNVYVSDTIKPVKLFKAVREAPPRVLRAGPKRTVGVLPDALRSSSISKKTHVEKRKQSLSSLNAKVEARIDLVDSDEPMEEEYLVDSSDDESLAVPEMEGDQMLVEALEALESDDSSDDEPLAKKFKRLKDVNSKDENIKETNIYDEIPDVADPNELINEEERLGTDKVTPTNTASSENALKEHPAGAIKTTYRIVKERIVKIMESTPPNEVRSEPPVEGNEFDEDDIDDEELDKAPPELTFFSDNSEGGDDDCILGV